MHNAREGTSRRSFGYLWPVLLLAGLIGLLWYWGSRPNVRAGRDDDRVAERTAAARDKYKYGTTALLEQLKVKYQSVIREAETQGIHISKLMEHDGKLVIEGTAPSAEAANKVWNEIKRVDPGMRGVMANFPVKTSMGMLSQPERTESDVTSRAKEALSDVISSPADKSHMYMVKSGDTLSKLSREFYGNTHDYMRILNANKDLIKDPNVISVGQELRIPKE